MNFAKLTHPAQFFLEIGQDFVRLSDGASCSEIPVERRADGGLTEVCCKTISSQLAQLIQHKGWQPRPRVLCATSARGVSLRRLALPQASPDELRRLVPLQVESEFPLPPEQLAWGYQVLDKPNGASNQDVLVAAVRKDYLEEYTRIVTDCGAVPVFTLAALARSYVCPQPPGIYSLLHLERGYSELVTIENGAPSSVRVFTCGLENLAAPELARGNGRDVPGSAAQGQEAPASFGGIAHRVAPARELQLVQQLRTLSLGRVLYVSVPTSGASGANPTQLLKEGLGEMVQCQAVPPAPESSGSLAILGLQLCLDREAARPSLVLEAKPSNGKARLAHAVPLKWAAWAVGLLMLALLVPYLEAITLKTHLAHKLASIKSEQDRLGVLDRELDFLQYLKANQPPYVDALLVLAKAAPPGTRFDSVVMNRRGEVSLRGSLRDGQQVADLRSKLIDSGFFSGVSIEEQTPTPDRQKVNVRMSAQWKPADKRTVPSLEPAASSLSGPGGHQGPAFPPPSAPVPAGKPVNLPVLKN